MAMLRHLRLGTNTTSTNLRMRNISWLILMEWVQMIVKEILQKSIY